MMTSCKSRRGIKVTDNWRTEKFQMAGKFKIAKLVNIHLVHLMEELTVMRLPSEINRPLKA